jgi:uncharacterized membrane protein
METGRKAYSAGNRRAREARTRKESSRRGVLVYVSTRRPGRRGLWAAITLLCLIGAAVVIRRTLALWPVVMHGYRRPALQANPALAQFAALDDIFARHALLTLVHILPGLLFVTLGPLQFSSSLRARRPMWHRVSGRVFLCAALTIGISAFAMSFVMPAIGGPVQASATAIFSAYFLFSLGKAFWHIRRREIARHRRWTIRAFSTGIAVATIRPIVGIFFATSRLTGLTPREFFGFAFWIGFLLHLVLTEWWLGSNASEREVAAA